jgi:hypothetical protein
MFIRDPAGAEPMSKPSQSTECPSAITTAVPAAISDGSSVRRRCLPGSPLQRSLCCLLTSVVLCGCASSLMNMPGAAMMANRFAKDDDDKAAEDKEKTKDSKREKEEDNDFVNRVETPLLSEYISVEGNTVIVLRGVGLVTGLNGTGGDPTPSALRTQLQNEMARRGIKNSKQILASPNTAMVVVTAYLPAMVRKDQRFDVRVALPPNSNAKSLKGGWLLETRMFEEQTVEGRGSLKGHEYAVAGGAILTSLGVKDNREERQAELMSGTIPGGAISKTDRDLSIVLRTNKRGSRNSERVANAVSERFHTYNKYGQRIPCAKAKTDRLVELKTHEQYINNFDRYQDVIRRIAINESDVARRMRLEQLARDIMDTDKCEKAAIELEAIGNDAIPFLKDALKSEHFAVRFLAAESLAYLGESAGVSTLLEAAKTQPAFRIYALVALSVVDDADAIVALRDLMSEPSLETRYGAFRAMKELDPRDPFLSPVGFKDRFVMYVIDSQGLPMVHVTRRRAPEVVLFGADQSLQLPVVLNAGSNIRVIGESGRSDVEITHYALNAEPQRHRVPNRLLDIIRTCGQLEATYPDIVQMLIEAEQQHNFVGQFGIDRLPQAGRLYVRDGVVAAEAVDEADSRRIGKAKMLPELFDELDEEELKENESEEKLMSLNFTEVEKEDAKADAKAKSRGVSSSEDADEATEDSESAPEDMEESVTSESRYTNASDDAESGKTADVSSGVEESEDQELIHQEESDNGSSAESSGDSQAWFGRRLWNRMRSPFSELSEPEL